MPSLRHILTLSCANRPGIVAKVSTAAIGIYGQAIRALRSMTNDTVNQEPKWRHPRAELTTGYHPSSY